jgi:geranylgeranyl pyrophosphate synthase
LSADFSSSIASLTKRVDRCLDDALPPGDALPARLHEAMRYAVLNGGKRVRPMLVYAAGECMDVPVDKLDPVAVAIELIHAFSLVHDDLPAMDDDDLRRGLPTVHKQYDEATAILAADALQPLAFQSIADSTELTDAEKVAVTTVITHACGSQGMTGGQSIDLASEGKSLTIDELRTLHALKTGALLSACVFATSELAINLSDSQAAALATFAEATGLAFQIRDDILDVEGETEVIGKPAGADERRNKATWPAIFGLEASRQYCDELLTSGITALEPFGERAGALRWIAKYIVERNM